MLAAARLQSEVMRWLNTREFTAFDKCCAGTTGWPNWHYKVLTLYAGYIAFNTLAPQLERIVTELREGTGVGPVVDGTRHAHVLHMRGYFSKHDLADGKYDDVDLATLDPRRLNEWCTGVVLTSIRMPESEFRAYVDDPSTYDAASPAVRKLDLPEGAQRALNGPHVYDRERPPARTSSGDAYCWSERWSRWLVARPDGKGKGTDPGPGDEVGPGGLCVPRKGADML